MNDSRKRGNCSVFLIKSQLVAQSLKRKERKEKCTQRMERECLMA